MWQKLIDIGTIIEMRDCVAGLTRLDFSVYDGTGHLLVPFISDDPIIKMAASSAALREEYERFARDSIEKAILRRGASLFKGPMNQYQCFIPAQTGDISLVMVGSSLYTSAKEIEEFLLQRGPGYGLSVQEVRSLTKGMVFIDLRGISEICGNVHRLFNLSLREHYEKNLNMERYRRLRTIVDLLSEIEQDMTEDKIYTLISDTIIFLFGGDTVSIMTQTLDKFIPVLTTGRFKRQVEMNILKADNAAIMDAIKNHRPVICTEAIDLLRFGYPDEITSLYLFPISLKDETFGLLGIFNSQFSRDAIDSISKLCSLAGCVLRTISLQRMYSKNIRDLTAINLAAINLGPAFKDPDALYESIVEIASRLTNAEKASLMLPGEERGELLVRAVKGMNKWIARNIRIRAGEGIAGKVYKDGSPLIISDIERDLSARKRPNYRTGSFVSIPLRIGDETIGVLNLSDKVSGEVFSEADMTFLQYFASYASIAIRGAHYYKISEEMRTLSITDSLTGLFNRRYFDDRLFEELLRATRYESVFSLAIFDIDDFKLFNDTEGHLAGDEVLKAIANISRDSLRSIDIIARFGGEEFSIIMPQTGREEAFGVAERVRKNIRNLMPLNWKNFPHERITVSVGVATFPMDGRDARSLIKSADKALYRAKVSGKDKTVTSETDDPLNEDMHLRKTAPL